RREFSAAPRRPSLPPKSHRSIRRCLDHWRGEGAMIVDCEVYYHGPDRRVAGKLFGVEHLEALCREAAVDRAVLMPAPTFRPRNRLVVEPLDAAPPQARARFLGCVLLNPHFGDEAVDELERAVKEWGFRAAKLMPPLHAVNLFGGLAHAVMRKAQ